MYDLDILYQNLQDLSIYSILLQIKNLTKDFRKDFFMSFRKIKHVTCVLSLALMCSVLSSHIRPVYATNDVNELEESTSDLQNELSDLNKDLETLQREIASISEQIESTSAHIAEVRESLALAKGEEEAQYDAMKQRIVYIYESGNTDLFEMLLSSSSLADFLNRAEYVTMVNEYDRNALQKLQNTREEILEQEAQLKAEEENLQALQQQLNSKANAITSQISETSTELAEYQRKLERAKEEAKKAEEALKQPIVPVAPPPSIPSRDNVNFGSNYAVSEQELLEFAALLQCEAGTSHEEGILAVASVVVNRMNHSAYPNTLHGVIFQSGQFTPAGGSRFNRILANGVNPTCLRIAKEALAGKNNVGGCLSFRAASSGRPGMVIGGNVFF